MKGHGAAQEDAGRAIETCANSVVHRLPCALSNRRAIQVPCIVIETAATNPVSPTSIGHPEACNESVSQNIRVARAS